MLATTAHSFAEGRGGTAGGGYRAHARAVGVSRVCVGTRRHEASGRVRTGFLHFASAVAHVSFVCPTLQL